MRARRSPARLIHRPWDAGPISSDFSRQFSRDETSSHRLSTGILADAHAIGRGTLEVKFMYGWPRDKGPSAGPCNLPARGRCPNARRGRHHRTLELSGVPFDARSSCSYSLDAERKILRRNVEQGIVDACLRIRYALARDRWRGGREMERKGSPLASIPPFGWDFQSMRVFRSDVVLGRAER